VFEANETVNETVNIALSNPTGGATLSNARPCSPSPITKRPFLLVSRSACDLNSDGHVDLAVFNFGNYVTILLGKGDGTFETRLLGVGNGSASITVGDFNDDGRPDLATADRGAGTVSILVNNTKRMSGFPEDCENREKHCRSSDLF
jgi:hypothetical protein